MKGLLITYTLAYGGSVLSLFSPFYGLLVYICFAVIKPESLWFWSVPAGNYSRIIAISLIASWAIRGFGDWRLGRATLPVLMIIAFWTWAVLGTLVCEVPSVAWAFVESNGKIVLPVVIGATLLQNWNQLRLLAWTLTLSLGYVAYDLNMSYFDGFNRLQEIGFATMDNNSVTISFVSGAGLAFFLGLGAKQWILKGLAFLSAAFLTHAVFFSFSRGGMLSLVIVGLVTAYLIPKTSANVSLLIVGVITALAMAGPGVRERFMMSFANAQERDGSAQSRLDMWQICWDIAIQNPFFGVGPDHFPVRAHEFGLPPGKEAHSLWLQQLAEMGFPGVIFLLGFYSATCFRLLKSLRERRLERLADPFAPTAARMVVAALVGFGVAAQFVSLEGLEFPYYVALLGIGVLKLESITPARLTSDNSVASVTLASAESRNSEVTSGATTAGVP